MLFRLQSNVEPIMFPHFPKSCNKILWDSLPTGVVAVFENKLCTVYDTSKYSIDSGYIWFDMIIRMFIRCKYYYFQWFFIKFLDKYITKFTEMPILSDQTPLQLYNNDISIATSDGSLSSVVLASHLNISSDEPKEQFKLFLQMRKLNDAWRICKSINEPSAWDELGRAAISQLDINFGKYHLTGINLPIIFTRLFILFSDKSVSLYWRCSNCIFFKNNCLDWRH